MKSIRKKLLTKKQLADRLCVPPSIVDAWMRFGRIPSVKIAPRKTRYDASEVEAALNREFDNGVHPCGLRP